MKHPKMIEIFGCTVTFNVRAYIALHYLRRRYLYAEFKIYFFNFFLNEGKEAVSLISFGSLFHRKGPLVYISLLPISVFALRTIRLFAFLVLIPSSVFMVLKLYNQSGKQFLNTLKTKVHILNVYLSLILSHPNSLINGETCSYFLMFPFITRAAKFWSFCTLPKWTRLVDPQTVKQ